MPGPLVLVDTDYNSDVDDLVTHAYLFGALYADEISGIVGIITASLCPWSAPAIERVNRWHGYPDIPVGAWKGNGGPYDSTTTITSCTASWWGSHGSFCPEVAAEYPGDLTTSNVPDGVELYRQLLSDADDDSITILLIGYHTLIYDVLQTPGDSIDARTGIELFNAKVTRIVCGGSKVGSTQPNFNWTQAPDYTKWILANVGEGLTVDVPFHVHPNNNGAGMNAASDAVNQPTSQIVRYAMRSFFETDPLFESGSGFSDPGTSLALVKGSTWGYNEVRGTFTWDDDGDSWPVPGDSGREVWTADGTGPHVRLERSSGTDSFYVNEFDANVFHAFQEPVDPDPGSSLSYGPESDPVDTLLGVATVGDTGPDSDPVDVLIGLTAPGTIVPTTPAVQTSASAPTLTPQAATIAPVAPTATVAGDSPTLTPAAASLTPDVPAAAAASSTPALTPAAGTLNPSPPAVTTTAGGPELVPASVTLTPSDPAVVASAALPMVTGADGTLTPADPAITTTAGAPSLTPAAATVTPTDPHVDLIASVPTATGPDTLRPTDPTVTVAGGIPTLVPDAASITPTAPVVVLYVDPPSAIPAASTLTPSAPAATAAAVAPQLELGAATLRPADPATVATSSPATPVPSATTLTPSPAVVAVVAGVPTLIDTTVPPWDYLITIPGTWHDTYTPGGPVERIHTVATPPTIGDAFILTVPVPAEKNPPAPGEVTVRQFALGDLVKAGPDEIQVADDGQGGLVVSVPLSVADTTDLPPQRTMRGQVRLEVNADTAATVADFYISFAPRKTPVMT